LFWLKNHEMLGDREIAFEGLESSLIIALRLFQAAKLMPGEPFRVQPLGLVWTTRRASTCDLTGARSDLDRAVRVPKLFA
jgi:hypothetical protein